MISAGYIGGGMPDPAASTTVVNTPPAATFGTGGDISMPVAQGANASDLTGKQLLQAWQSENSANRTMGYVGMGLNLGNQILSYFAQTAWFDANVTINDRRALAAENISGDRKEVELRWLETQDKISKRTDGPGGTRERLARIEANRDVEMYQIRSRTQREIAATRGLDQAFSMRSEYNYGTPYSPYA